MISFGFRCPDRDPERDLRWIMRINEKGVQFEFCVLNIYLENMKMFKMFVLTWSKKWFASPTILLCQLQCQNWFQDELRC
jgi:hypothetical protein